MFCFKCGKQLADGSKFCDQCGTAQPGAATSPSRPAEVHLDRSSLSGNKIMILVVCAVMLLSMLLLPVASLRSDRDFIDLMDDFGDRETVNFLKEADIGEGEEFVTGLSRFAFVLSLGAILATLLFAFTNRKSYSILTAVANLAVLLLYGLFLATAWAFIEGKRATLTLPSIGGFICFLGTIALIVLVLAEFRNVDVKNLDWKQEAKNLSELEAVKKLKSIKIKK